MQQFNSGSSDRMTRLEGVELPKGNYHLERVVSVSNMSVIYKAIDRSSRRYVAIKVLLSKRYLQHFKNEVEITWGHRRNIASALRYDLDGEQLPDGTVIRYMVMKWLSGPSLSERIKALKARNASTPELLRFCDQLLAKLAPALDELHDIGLAHLDIKPSNILFNTDEFETNEPYLIDFGIAQWLNVRAEEPTQIETDGFESMTRITNENEVVAEGSDRPGTANYMAPEQWQGAVRSGAADQYALAITIYEIITGRISPFHDALLSMEITTGSKNTPSERRAAWQRVHLEEQPKPIQHYRRDVPKAVWRVLAKAMDKSPEKRYPNVQAFHKAFRQAAGAMMDGRHSRLIDVDQPTVPEGGMRARRRPAPVLEIMGALAVLALGGTLIFVIVSSPSEDDLSAATPSAAAVLGAETDEPLAAITEEASPSSPPSATLSSMTMVETEEATPETEPSSVETQTDVLPTQTTTQTHSPTARTTRASPTPTPTSTRTSTPTRTPSLRSTSTPAPTLTPSPTVTESPSSTAVSVQPAGTITERAVIIITAAFTDTPSADLSSSTATFTATHTPSPTPTSSATRTASPVPAAPLAQTDVGTSAIELLSRLSEAARSANNFDCANFIQSYDALYDLFENSENDGERAILRPLLSNGASLMTLYDFCQSSQMQFDRSAQLPSSIANNTFRTARTALRTALRALET